MAALALKSFSPNPNAVLFLVRVDPAKGGHGGPPLQYVLRFCWGTTFLLFEEYEVCF